MIRGKWKICTNIIHINWSNFFFFNKYYSLKIINFLSPIYVIFSIPIRFLFEKLISSLYTLYTKKNKIIETRDKYKIIKLILDTSGDIVPIIGFLIYLGIIVLKCNKFDLDINPKIIERGINEIDNESNKSLITESYFTDY